MARSTSLFTFRNIGLLDAVTAAAMGVLLSAASDPLAALTALPAGFLFYIGLALFPMAAAIAVAALRQTPALVWLVILGNVLWVIASFALLASAWIAPNYWGVAFVAGQAAVVALLTLMEYAALRGGRAAGSFAD